MTTNPKLPAFGELALVAAQTAALECADDPAEFARIHRAILTAMQQTFPELKALACEEELK